MINYYSTVVGTGARTDPKRPLLGDAYPAVQWTQVGPDGGRVALRVTNPSSALLSDYRFPQVLEGGALEDYRAAVHKSLLLWEEKWTVTVSGIVMAAGIRNRANFASLMIMIRIGLDLASIQPTDTDSVVDAAGVSHSMTVSALRTFAISYGSAARQLMNQLYGKQAAANAATTAADLDAVTIP